MSHYRSTMIISIVLFICGLFILDNYYRSVLKNSFYAVLTANKEIIENENYFALLVSFKRFKSFYPELESFSFYVRGQRKSGNSSWPLYLDENNQYSPETAHLKLVGFFKYKLDYIFLDQDYLISIAYVDNKIYYNILGILFLSLILPFSLAILCRKWDLDNTQKIRNEYAVSLAAKAIHFVKTHIYFANELYKWTLEISKERENDPNFSKVISGFQNSQIEMEGIKSILRINSFIKASENIDVEKMLDLLLRCYKDNKVFIKKYFEHKNTLNIDRDVFIATVGNVLKNACEYSSGLVWIKTQENKNSFTILISNTGRYLNQSDVKKILRRGQSLEGSTGLGLTICQVWMDKIGGKLRIQSHKGANTFELIFPNILKTLVKKNKEKKSSIDKWHKNRVVIIEDIPSFKNKLCSEIEVLGFKAESYSDIDAFFNELENSFDSIDTIIVDRHLRGFDAVRDRFVDACRHYGYKGKVFLYTGDMSPAINRNAVNHFDLVLQKDEKVEWKKILNS